MMEFFDQIVTETLRRTAEMDIVTLAKVDGRYKRAEHPVAFPEKRKLRSKLFQSAKH